MNNLDLEKMIAFGVAGNFTGHLEQAGEIKDFLKVEAKKNAPKAIFPVFVPNSEDYLGIYPFSNKEIKFPELGDFAKFNLQIEPELAIIAELVYNDNKEVINIIPKFFTAYNDCSIRKEGARKIAEKKNWGFNSKGISSQILSLDSFDETSTIKNYRIASFLLRDKQIYEYGIDSRVADYSYFYQELLTWIVEKINTQQDQDPISQITPLIKKANYPQNAIISVGATRYTEFGEKNFLQPKDISLVIIYDETKYNHQNILDMIAKNEFAQENISVLKQEII